MFFSFSSALWASNYGFDTISCNSVAEAQDLMPNIFLQMGISVQSLEDISSKDSPVAYLNSDQGLMLRFIKHEGNIEDTLKTLYPNHVRVQSSRGWYILDTKRVLFAQIQEDELRISSEEEVESTSSLIPETRLYNHDQPKVLSIPSTNRAKVHINQ